MNPHSQMDPFRGPPRFLAHTLAYLVAKPILWILHQLGYSPRLWQRIFVRVKRSVLEGSFGDYRPTEHDVVVCTYPKCGTNWTMQIAHQLATLGDGEFAHIHEKVPWPDFAKQELVRPLDDESAVRESPTGLRVIKTHLEWDRVPYSESARYICVLRDPKDAFVSSYHFVRDVMFGPLMPRVETWLDLFCSDHFVQSWPEHLDGYWRDRAKANLLILTYEEMLADAEGAVRRIADFMGVKLDDELLATVCEKSSFAYMKGIRERFDPPALSPLSSADRKMLRRGVSGASSELLNAGQQRRIDDFVRAELERLGSDFPYDEHYGDPPSSPLRDADEGAQ